MRTAVHLFLPGVSRRLVLFFVLSLLLCASPAARASAPADYDLTVLIVATGPGPDQVAISYSHVVNHSEFAAAVKALSRDVGITAGSPSLREEPVLRGASELATSAVFLAPGLVRGRTGELPVLALARALPDWRHLRLVCLVGKDFRFAGPGDRSAEGYRIRLVGKGTSYQYDVERTNRGESAEGEKPAGSEATPAATSGQKASWLWGGIRAALFALVGRGRAGRSLDSRSVLSQRTMNATGVADAWNSNSSVVSRWRARPRTCSSSRGARLRLRVHGRIVPTDLPVLTPEDTERLA